MRFASLLIFTLALAGPVQAQNKPAVPEALPAKISFPPEVPAQVPAAVTPTLLTPNLFYVISFDKALIIRALPAGIVTVSVDTGPIKMRGVFVNSSGQVETRTFSSAFIYTIQPVGTGIVDLNVSLAGATDASADIVRSLNVQMTPAPPIPPTPPTPPAPTDPLTAAVKASLTSDNVPLTTAATLATVYRGVATTQVNDPTVTTYASLFAAVKPLQDKQVPPVPDAQGNATSIPATRKVLGQYFLTAFGTNDQLPVDRTLAAKTFNAAAAALESVK